ncbi:MAG: NAD(P)-binding domain-containing protein [Tepidisphaeraceae bacterium]
MSEGARTIGILYSGEMGAALASALRGKGFRVVTTLDGRSERTAARARASGLVVLDSLIDVVREAEVVFSLVSPASAENVARDYCAVAHLALADAVYVDANSIGPDTTSAIAGQVVRADRSFVDGSINGLATNLTTSGTLFLSGPRAGDVATLFGDAVRVRVLGETIGAASTMKMLLGGLSKGLCGLFLELALVADRRGMLGEMLETTREIYPGVQAVVDRTLPTYAQHSARRSTEMRELLATAQASSIEPCVIDAIRRLHELLANTNFTTASGADVRSIVRHLQAAGLLSGSESNAV